MISKLDAFIQLSLKNQPQKKLLVFIHTKEKINQKQAQQLIDFGVHDCQIGKSIFTANLPALTLEKIAQEEWVLYLKTSNTLNLA